MCTDMIDSTASLKELEKVDDLEQLESFFQKYLGKS
jgi:hypothetical protein